MPSKYGSKIQVWNGSHISTKSGLKKSDLALSKTGKVVSKKRQAIGRARYANIKKFTRTAEGMRQLRKRRGKR